MKTGIINNGLIVPETFSRAFFFGRYVCEHRRNGRILDRFEGRNLVVDEGVNYILNAGLASNVGGGQAQIAPWYIGLMANYTPVAGSTMAQFGVNEIISYVELTRLEYDIDALATAKSLTNSTNRAIFTINQDGTDVYGFFVCSNSTKSGVSGIALSGVRFPTQKTYDDTDELLLTYNFGGDDDGI